MGDHIRSSSRSTHIDRGVAAIRQRFPLGIMILSIVLVGLSGCSSSQSPAAAENPAPIRQPALPPARVSLHPRAGGSGAGQHASQSRGDRAIRSAQWVWRPSLLT